MSTTGTCGTAHAVEHSSDKPKHNDRLFHLGEPFFDDEEPEFSYNEDRTVLTMKWYKGPPRVGDWDGGIELATDKFADLACVHCGSVSLTDTWEGSQPSPRCSGAMKSVAFWIT